jgi:hypothetical protein
MLYNQAIMVVLELIQQSIVSVLVAYLAFTNSLAVQVESLFAQPTEDTQVVQEKAATEQHEVLQKIETQGESSERSAFNFLRTHSEFQKAALIASTRDEISAETQDNRPLNQVVEDALVNIYCQYKTEKYIRTTTGTGFFINQKGVILTNAHVAQFLLLKNTKDVVDDVECVVRSGNPAEPKYEAELLYISPKWIFDNSNVITDESPIGTGERDYALLYISKTTDNSPLPIRFPAIAIDTALLSRGIEHSSVITAGYPAEALFKYGADAKLAPVTASTSVGALYTFGSNYADLFSISESPVGEQGASGGPIATYNMKSVIGLIVTKGDPETEGEHSLRAITLSYIDRTITEETGYSLAQNMQGDVALRGAVFKKAMVPFLAGILEDELRNK